MHYAQYALQSIMTSNPNRPKSSAIGTGLICLQHVCRLTDHQTYSNMEWSLLRCDKAYRLYLNSHLTILQGQQRPGQGQVAGSPVGQQPHKHLPIADASPIQHIQALRNIVSSLITTLCPF